MQTINDRFFDKFKALEKICNDMFGCQSGVTEYINQLKVRSDCETNNSTWFNFYNKLCTCRGKRNALAHSDDFVFIYESDIEFLDKLYQDILNRRDPLCKLPKLHTAYFCVDGKCIARVDFKEGDRHIKEPEVSPKTGHVFKWEKYTLGNEDIEINGTYEPIIHKAKFYVDGKLIKTVDFKEGTRRISEPEVPKKEGYVGKWEHYTLGNKDIVINAVFTSIYHKASFYAGERLIATVPFTEGADHICESPVPQISGYGVRWGKYTLGDKDIIVKAVATKKKETGSPSTQKTIVQGHITAAEIERNNFWNCFDRYLEQQGNPFSVAHVKGGKNQAAGNINNPNPMAMQTICCQYRYRDHEIWVLVYINDRADIYNHLLKRREEIEEDLGYKVDWIENGPRTNSVKIIKKALSTNNKTYDQMVVGAFPYIKDFIRVFEPYLKVFLD